MKILVLGTAGIQDTSELTRLQTKVSTLHQKHGPFDVAFCFGRVADGQAFVAPGTISARALFMTLHNKISRCLCTLYRRKEANG